MTLLSIPAPTQVTTARRVVVGPAHELPEMTRYRDGTYSHTVDRIVFADGSTARTDLIRLNPTANIADHEAFAGGIAAIWYFTNGLALDTQPLNVPIAARRGPGRCGPPGTARTPATAEVDQWR